MPDPESAPAPGVIALPTTRSSAVVDQLRRLIQTGELRPGERLRQAEIAARFGVSTTPVREAFTALAREGLIRKDDMRGAVVFEPNLMDLRENYEIRTVLESLAIGLAAERLTDEQIGELDSLVRQMRREKSGPTYHALNRRLHATIYQAAGRPRLNSLIESLRDSSDAYFAMFGATAYDRAYQKQVREEHEEIVVALRKRSARDAKAMIVKHLQHNLAFLTRCIEESDAAKPLRDAASG